MTTTISLTVEHHVEELVKELESELTLNQIVDIWPNASEIESVVMDRLDTVDEDTLIPYIEPSTMLDNTELSYVIEYFNTTDILDEIGREDIAQWLLGNT